jgi:hypothetical protein
MVEWVDAECLQRVPRLVNVMVILAVEESAHIATVCSAHSHVVLI